jgi:hypothetical protein
VHGVGDQLGAQEAGYRPADDRSAGQVDHSGQAVQALPGPGIVDVADVATLELG